MNKHGFELRKWYFDCIDDAGNSIIAYTASIVWRAINLSVSGIIARSKRIRSEWSIGRAVPPVHTETSLFYENPLFDVSLTSLHQSIIETLYVSEAGSIEWLCYYPSFLGQIQTSMLNVKGRGYAEELRMTIPPWELKIDELWWGRFVSDENYVTWIQWKGAWPRFFIWCNGVKFTDGAITNSYVHFGEHTLRFNETTVIRKGTLISTVFKKLPLMKRLIPMKALLIDETKWQSRSELRHRNGAVSKGWSIQEKVLF